MAKITITIPDGEKCENCNFLVSSYFEDAMRCPNYKYHCSIFKCKVENGQKCVACKICAKEA